MAEVLIDPTPYFVRAAGLDARYGTMDCALALADYLAWARGLNSDPAEGFRGTYATEEECHAVIRREGGLVRIFRRIAEEYGLTRISLESPPSGAFGVVRYQPPGRTDGHFGGIIARSGRIAIKCGEGLLFTRAAHPVILWTP